MMQGTQAILPHAVCAALYGALAFYFWRRHWSDANDAATGAETGARHGIEHAALLVPFALHTWLLAGSMFGEGGMYLGVGNALSLILWLTVLIYGLGSLFYRLDGLHALVLPAAAVAVALPFVFPSTRALANTETLAFKAHLLISMAVPPYSATSAVNAWTPSRRISGAGPDDVPPKVLPRRYSIVRPS